MEETDKSLYDRLGGVFAIAAVIDYFSDEVVKNPKVGQNSPNPALREWSTQQVDARLPGLKWMRTLWVCAATGGPYEYIGSRAASTASASPSGKRTRSWPRSPHIRAR